MQAPQRRESHHEMECKCAHRGSNAGVGAPCHFVWCLWWECCLVWSPSMGWCEWAASSQASCKWGRSAKDKYKMLAQRTKMYHLVSDQGCHSWRKGRLTHENFLEWAMNQFWLTKLDGKLTIDTGSGRDSRNWTRHVPHCVRLSVQEWEWRKSYHRSQTRTWGTCQLVFDWGACSVSKSSWQLVQRLATGLDCNWSQLDCSCQLPSLPKIKKTSCGPVATGLFEDRSLGPWSPHSGAYTLFFSYFYLFIWIY